MPTEEEIERVYRETWGRADDLKRRHRKVWYINVNRGFGRNKNLIITTRPPERTTFAFDYAVADLSPREVDEIRRVVRKFREGGRGAGSTALDRLEKTIDRHPNVLGFWA